MKKFLSLICLSLIAILSCSYTFPDKLPEWKSIETYMPAKLEFHKTTVKDFQSLVPDAEVYDLQSNIKIITTYPDKDTVYEEVNVGFRNNILDWLEFRLNKEVPMSEMVNIYGFPRFIDKEYSEDVDYYNYDNFNIATNKANTFAQSITIFDLSDIVYENSKTADSGETNFFVVFPNIKPGITTEENFITDYPRLLPYMEEDFDINTIYTLVDELNAAQTKYKKAVLKFENGILSWVNLVPVNPNLQSVTKNITEKPEIEELNDIYDLHIYKNFILVVNREYKKVTNIGLVSYDKRF